MMFEHNHPIPAHSDWERFKSSLHMLDIIDEVIDRDELGIPDEYLPLARGAAIASRVCCAKHIMTAGDALAAGTRQ